MNYLEGKVVICLNTTKQTIWFENSTLRPEVTSECFDHCQRSVIKDDAADGDP
jgi:hypothetical protein